MDDSLTHWLIAGGGAAVLAIVGWAARRIVSDVSEVAADVKAISTKLTQHDGAIADLQKGLGEAKQENRDQWQRINGVAGNHGDRLTKLEVLVSTLLDRKP